MKLLLSYGLALVGLGMVVLAVVKALASNLSYPSARLMLMNLFRTNPNQAGTVCQSLPGTFFEPLGATIKTVAQMGSTDPATIAAASRPTYDGTGTAVVMGFKAHLTKAKIGLMMTFGAMVLSVLMATKQDKVADDPNYDPNADVVEVAEPGFFEGPGPLVIIALLAAGGILWIVLRKLELERSIVRARAELLPELERAFIEGRYRLPPKP
ncbi:MAG: hypothetical protein H0X17_08345 [Deltaproteobacteria bacterium]|nr:hypothetical protein [Deltaproteobacteria bacterium]